MTLAAVKKDIARKLRTAMPDFTGEIAEEYDAYDGLPVIIITTGTGENMDFAGSIVKWEFKAELRLVMGEEGIRDQEYHRDLASPSGFVKTIYDMKLDGGTLNPTTTNIGAEAGEIEGGMSEYLWVEYLGDLYVSS